MGSESYGLIGFFAMLQAWFALLDLGLTPTISRESARYHGGGLSALNFRQLFRSLSLLFTAISFLGGVILILLSDIIAKNWLKFIELSYDEVVTAVKIMAISVSLRWLGGLFRGVISGAEKFVWLSCYNSLMATLRFVLVFVSMHIFGYSPSVFFLHQLVVAVLELVLLILQTYKILPSVVSGEIGWSLAPISAVFKFSLGVAFSSSVWILLTQVDKFVLSGVLPLSEYGYFSLAILVANGVLLVTGPVSVALMPRMARLYSEGKTDEMLEVYSHATQVVSVIAASTSIVVALLAEPLLFVWTGDRSIAISSSKVLSLYAIGNSFLAVGAFPYYLQFAMGNLRLHLIGNLGNVLLLVPLIIYAAKKFGAVGAGYIWLIVNGLFLFTWVFYVHQKLVKGLSFRWILKDVVAIYTPVFLILFILLDFFHIPKSRWYTLVYIAAFSLVSLLIASLSSSVIRSRVLSIFKKSNS